MSAMTIVTGGLLPGKTGVILLARIVGTSGVPITQATISSIAYVVQNVTQATVAQASTAMTVSSVIFDNLVTTDDAWKVDSPTSPGPDLLSGYNFKFTVPASVLSPTADLDEYRVDVTFVPATGQNFVQPFSFSLLKTY